MEAIDIRIDEASPSAEPRIIGRYRLFGEIAAGGMAAVHLGRLAGPGGFARTVAVKRLHAQFARDPEFVAMFLDEARLAARISHPNVVSVLDIVTEGAELFLVMEYVRGAPLSLLRARGRTRTTPIPPPIAVSILCGALAGLHAAHDAKDEGGASLGIVHRDVSPQNILVGADGIARVFDFGIAKATGRLQITRKGQLKGKLSYMAPEQIDDESVSRATDVYAASVVLWEALTGQRLFLSSDERGTLFKVLHAEVPPPSSITPGLSAALDRVVLRGLDRDPAKRFATALEMAQALSACCRVASATEVAQWVESLVQSDLARSAELVAAIECADLAGDAPRDLAAQLAIAANHPVPAATMPEISDLLPRSTRDESQLTLDPPDIDEPEVEFDDSSAPRDLPSLPESRAAGLTTVTFANLLPRPTARPTWRTVMLAATLLAGIAPATIGRWIGSPDASARAASSSARSARAVAPAPSAPPSTAIRARAPSSGAAPSAPKAD